MTQEKTFDNLFPELKGKGLTDEEPFDSEEFTGNEFTGKDFHFDEDIQKHCLSKQRVSEAIEKLQMAYPSSYGTFNCSINVNELKRKLGLE